MNGAPWLEWAVNVTLCFTVWAVVSLVFRSLQMRRIWNDVMTIACFMWVLFLRFRHQAAVAVPVLVFAIGAYRALDQTRFNRPARAVMAVLIGVAWMEFGIRLLISLMYYFCAGCFFGK